ncbi:MAG: hypothetical protein ACPG52_12925 [Cognaticolwellia sp.]
MTIFVPHGTLKMDVEDNIILIDAQGPWNIEYLDHLHQKMAQAVLQVDRNNYGVLLTPKGEAISVEAGLEYHANFVRQGSTKAVALNLAHCTTSLLTENLFSKIYRAANMKHAFFDNALDARCWLENELKTTTAPTS